MGLLIIICGGKEEHMQQRKGSFLSGQAVREEEQGNGERFLVRYRFPAERGLHVVVVGGRRRADAS